MKLIFIVLLSGLYLVSCKTNFHEVETQLASQTISSSMEDITSAGIAKDSTHVKKIKPNVYQTVSVDPQIEFSTWEEQENGVTLVNKSNFEEFDQEYADEISEFYLQTWEENKDFYVGFEKVIIDQRFLNTAATGTLDSNLSIKVGSSESELLLELGNPVVIDWYLGGMYYVYGEIAFVIGDHYDVVAISMPGTKLKTTLLQVETDLGAPSSTTYDEGSRLHTYTYKVGNYRLMFEAYSEDSTILNVWLLRKA